MEARVYEGVGFLKVFKFKFYNFLNELNWHQMLLAASRLRSSWPRAGILKHNYGGWATKKFDEQGGLLRQF